ncbi:MAG: ATP synthase F0 subunit B [Acidobacteriota bacterium]|nr:ATP synthase F0 subunit B [Acidobacteriota bacterium]
MRLVLFALILVIGPLRAAEHESKPEKDMTPWLWANFFILAGGAGYLAAKKGGPYFASRSQDIRQGMADAEKVTADSQARVAAVNSKIANLQTEIESIRVSILQEQKQEHERIQRETAAEMQRIQTHAEYEMEAAGKAARLELRRHAAQLALELAERKLRARMTPQMQDVLTRSFVEGLKQRGQQAV